MKLTEIRIDNFRSIKECHLFLNEVTAVIGENNAGKTALLRALNSVFNWEYEQAYFGSTPILVDKGQKGRGTASCNLPATRYIIEANPLNVLKPRAFRFAACIMELIPSQTAFVMRW